MGLGTANTTPPAQARLAALSVLGPDVQVAGLLFQLGLPLQVDLKSTERVTQVVGARLAADPNRAPFAPTSGPVALGFDGVMVSTRSGKLERVGEIARAMYPADPAGQSVWQAAMKTELYTIGPCKLETAEPVLQLRPALLTQPRLDLRAYAATKKYLTVV